MADKSRRTTPDMRSGREERFAQLLKRRADAGGVTQAEMVEDAKRRAPTLETLREHARTRGLSLFAPWSEQESRYPGPDCLEPYEIEEYIDGALAAGRVAHTRECPSCRGLLSALTPSEERSAAVLNEVRQLATQRALAEEGTAALPVHSAGVFSFVRDPALPRPRWLSPTAIGAVAATLVLGAGAGQLVRPFWLEPRRIAQEELNRPVQGVVVVLRATQTPTGQWVAPVQMLTDKKKRETYLIPIKGPDDPRPGLVASGFAVTVDKSAVSFDTASKWSVEVKDPSQFPDWVKAGYLLRTPASDYDETFETALNASFANVKKETTPLRVNVGTWKAVSAELTINSSAYTSINE